ncbi:PAAR domain-containing protein [Paraburkholderia sp. B3]|uniref:PAAR domain-containing protein n=1 Tax=Paraburkholderia sp. B3 TaxID=3134791 RepID=UPI0039825A97
MDHAICREGDETSHGGKVIRVSGSMEIDGHHNARLGDWVSCPAHGDNPITEAGAMLDEGVPIVVHRCRTACGSLVIASGDMTISDQEA